METHLNSASAGSEPRILHETERWLILDKPSGWHTVARRRHNRAGASTEGVSRRSDIESWLRGHFGWARALDEAGIVHRLDLETSGCLLVAKGAAEQWRLREQFQRDDSRAAGVRKIYLAVVGADAPQRGEFCLFFTSRYKRSKKVTVLDAGDPRHAGRCHWRVPALKETGGGSGRNDSAQSFRLLEIELLGPGRRHQIRAGLAHLGYPLLGDTLYGGAPFSRTAKRGRNVLDAPAQAPPFFLHAWRLTIDEIETVAPAPDSWPI